MAEVEYAGVEQIEIVGDIETGETEATNEELVIPGTLFEIPSAPSEIGRKKENAESGPQITKEHICMLIALFLEEAPFVTEREDITGAVVRRSNQTIMALEVTRNSIHPAMRLVTRFAQEMKGTEVFMSRPPCLTCTKLLMQVNVSKVKILPRCAEKEAPGYKGSYEGKDTRENIMRHFLVNEVRIAIDIPDVKYSTSQVANSYKEKVDMFIFEQCYFTSDEDAENSVRYREEVRDKMTQALEAAHEWLSRKTKQIKKWKLRRTNGNDLIGMECKVVRFFLKIGYILAERTTDHNRGVGAVLLSTPQDESGNVKWEEVEVISVGWNGYPRESTTYQYPGEKTEKLGFTLHAEHNAIIFRNTQTPSNLRAVVTKKPCAECMPLLKYLGMTHVYYPKPERRPHSKDKDGQKQHQNDK